jgi:hypothetical protein
MEEYLFGEMMEVDSMVMEVQEDLAPQWFNLFV